MTDERRGAGPGNGSGVTSRGTGTSGDPTGASRSPDGNTAGASGSPGGDSVGASRGPGNTGDQSRAARPAGPLGGPVQDSLFDEGVPGLPTTPADDVGYRGPTACAVAGITYRQLDYWARTGLVTPSIRDASGSGTQRLYSFRDILVLKLVRRLLDTGISLQNIRTAVGQLRAGGAEDLAEITLISDGTTVYEYTSADEVINLLQGGQGVFAIAVGRVVREVEGDLAELPGEKAGDEGTAAATDDELSARRRQRGA